MDLKRGIDMAATAVVKDIERRAKKVQSSDEIAQVGTISANGRRGPGPVQVSWGHPQNLPYRAASKHLGAIGE